MNNLNLLRHIACLLNEGRPVIAIKPNHHNKVYALKVNRAQNYEYVTEKDVQLWCEDKAYSDGPISYEFIGYADELGV